MLNVVLFLATSENLVDICVADIKPISAVSDAPSAPTSKILGKFIQQTSHSKSQQHPD